MIKLNGVRTVTGARKMKKEYIVGAMWMGSGGNG
jgi:hypothetical protein